MSDIDAYKVIEQIREALDMDDDETLVVKTPQFDRGDGVEPAEPPLTDDAMDALVRAEKETLVALGLRYWSSDSGLWLLPHEWHAHIPDDYELVNINGDTVTRSEYPAAPDKRFGVLSFGIVPEFEEAYDEH